MKPLTARQQQALKNFANTSICNDLMMLHNMRTNLWSAILRYQGTEMEEEFKASFDAVSQAYDKLQVFESEPSNKEIT